MGARTSKCRTSKTSKPWVLPSYIRTRDDSQLSLEMDIHPLETVQYIWFDKNADEDIQIQSAVEILQQNVENISIMNDRYQFKQWLMKLHDNEMIILIISCKSGKQLVPNIHDLPSIIAIYINCIDNKAHNKWAENYSKVCGVISNPSKLAQQVYIDAQNCQYTFACPPACSTGLPRVEHILESEEESQTGSLSKFQFIVLDLSARLNELALAMLKCLCSLTENSIIILNDTSSTDFDVLFNKNTLLFVSSEFAAKMGNKSEQIETIFILEDDKNKVDHRKRFATGEDLIFQLADELYQRYKTEANDYLIIGNTSMAEIKEKQANRIHQELKTIHQNYFTDKNTCKQSIDTSTTLIWIKSKFQNDIEINTIQNLFSNVISSFRNFDNQTDCQNYLLTTTGIVFLIINSDYEDSIVSNLQQLSNVKAVYRLNKSVITTYNYLRFQLAYDLMGYYKKLGTDCKANNNEKTAKDMFMKAYKLCHILADL